MSTLIPFPVAHTFLEAFGITERTRAYERWEKPNGFLLEDFDEVFMRDSPRVVTIDWRGEIEEALIGFKKALASIGYAMEIAVEDDITASFRVAEGIWHQISYSPEDGDGDCAHIARTVAAALPAELELRAGQGNDGADTAVFALLTRAKWEELSSADADLIEHFFVAAS